MGWEATRATKATRAATTSRPGVHETMGVSAWGPVSCRREPRTRPRPLFVLEVVLERILALVGLVKKVLWWIRRAANLGAGHMVVVVAVGAAILNVETIPAVVVDPAATATATTEVETVTTRELGIPAKTKIPTQVLSVHVVNFPTAKPVDNSNTPVRIRSIPKDLRPAMGCAKDHLPATAFEAVVDHPRATAVVNGMDLPVHMGCVV